MPSYISTIPFQFNQRCRDASTRLVWRPPWPRDFTHLPSNPKKSQTLPATQQYAVESLVDVHQQTHRHTTPLHEEFLDSSLLAFHFRMDEKQSKLDDASLEFHKRILQSSGIGEETYAKVVEAVLDCAFLFSLNLIRTEIDHPEPSSNNTSSVYTMIDGVCRSVGLREEAIELGVLRGLLFVVRSPRVLIQGDSLVHVVRTCYNVYLGGLSGTNRAVSKIASALIARNSILPKPPTQSVVAALHMVALHMVHCFQLAGFPKGLISCVTRRGSEIGDFLTMQPRVNCISFTGGDTGIAISKWQAWFFFIWNREEKMPALYSRMLT